MAGYPGPTKTAKLKTKQAVIAITQVGFNVIVQFAAFYVFLQALGLVIDQY